MPSPAARIGTRGPVTTARLAAGCALAAAGAAAIDLLDGADPLWTVLGSLLLAPPAAVLAVAAGRTAAGRVAAACWLGAPVSLAGAALGDRAGRTWWWLAAEALWWVGVALAGWPGRPGLAVLSWAAAVVAAAAAVLTGLPVPYPVASGAGLRAALTVAWAGWTGVELAVRPPG